MDNLTKLHKEMWDQYRVFQSSPTMETAEVDALRQAIGRFDSALIHHYGGRGTVHQCFQEYWDTLLANWGHSNHRPPAKLIPVTKTILRKQIQAALETGPAWQWP